MLLIAPMKRFVSALACLALLLLLAACGAGRGPESQRAVGHYKVGQPYRINGRWYYPEFDPGYDRIGTASWYGEAFDGLPTANGEIFDKDLITAAHPTLPLPSVVRVTNLENGRRLDLRVNDRGPFVGNRMIDLSQAAARKLGYEGKGLARVRVQFLSLADARGKPPAPTVAAVRPVLPEAPTRLPQPAPEAIQVASLTQSSRLPACAAGPQFVQVGAFAEADTMRTAMARVERLRPARVEPTFVGDRALARVRLGPVDGGAEARALLAQVQALGYTGAFLTPASGPGATSC